jgi:protein-tyrosine kinase
MSLIEAAVEKAKRKIAETGMPRSSDLAEEHVASSPRRETQSQADAATVAVRVAQARVLPDSPVDAAVMERNGVLLQMTDTIAQRSYRVLRTRVQQRMQTQGWHSLAVTASSVGEGKTLTSINLAISLARDINTWVYLVDLDLQRPKVASYLGLQFDKGLADYLGGTAQFEEIIYSLGVERLAVVPNSQPMERSSDLLGSPRIRELCASLASVQPKPIVIFDLPPLLVGDDVIKFAPNVDCTLFVVAEGMTSRATLQRATESLQEMNLLGVVLNRSAEREESGYY